MKREDQKEERRQRIISAAEQLIRETRSTDFSMQDLARYAGLSVPTSYNLIGSKAAVLYLLLNRFQDRVATPEGKKSGVRDPFSHVEQAGVAAVRVYISDADFIRTLMRFLIGAFEPEHRSAFMTRGFQYWYVALSPLRAALNMDDMRLRVLCRDFLMYYTGIIDFWAQGELSDSQFELTARHGTVMRLIPLANAEDAARLSAHVEKLQGRLHIPYSAPTSDLA